MFRKGFLSLISFLSFAFLCAAQSVSGNITATAVSPKDGSLWMGTEKDGLYRMGRNGRGLHYSVEGGQLTDNRITSLAVTSDGDLFILDGSGKISTYSSVKGFASDERFPTGVITLAPSADSAAVYALTSSALFRVNGDPVQLAGFSEPVSQLFSSPDGSLWVLGKSGSFNVSPDGTSVLHEGVQASGVLKLIPFEIETQPVKAAPERTGGRFPFAWCLVACLLALVAYLIWKLRKQPAASHIEPVPAPISAPVTERPVAETVPAPVKEHQAAPRKSVPAEKSVRKPIEKAEVGDIESALKATEFGRQVYNLVCSHLADSSYGVEQVADDLGITRIHVNRKLKSETGVSPSTVFKVIRMNKASRMLLEGKLSMIEVAQQCGFSSASYFSTAFKDYFSETPSEYLAKHSNVSDGVLELN